MKKRLLLIGLLVFIFGVSGIVAQTDEGDFAPIGAGYTDTFNGWLNELIATSPDAEIRVVVVASAFSYDPFVITPEEREELTTEAQGRVDEIQAACNLLITAEQTCVLVLAPIFIRDDALASTALDYFAGSVDGIFFLGGDQAIAMQILASTPVETIMEQKHDAGALIAGTSAGNAVQSKTMIAGYIGDFGPESGLQEGTIDIWNTSEKRGLSFGLDNLVLDQHFFQRTRLPRLLNVLSQPGIPRIGIGVDAYTGVFVRDRSVVGETFGLYTAAVVDAQSYASADNAEFVGGILSIHDVLTHLLAPGAYTYDLTTRQHSLAPLPRQEPRSFDTLRTPAGAGTLLLGGNLEYTLAGSPILARLVELSGGAGANILIVADGYATEVEAQSAAAAYATALGVASTTVVITGAPTPAEGSFTGILLIGKDKSLVNPAEVATVIGTRWQTGTPLLADNAMAAVLGAWYTNHPPTDIEGPNEELDVQGAFIAGNTIVAQGLGWISASFEPTLLWDKRLGRWFSLGYAYPETLVIGLTDDTALELDGTGARVLGVNGVLVLDMRRSTLALGTNNGYVIANALVDTYAPGEALPVNLLINGGFEQVTVDTSLPEFWQGKGLSEQDVVKTDKTDKIISREGSRAFKFQGSASKNSWLVQKLAGDDLEAGETLTLSAYLRGKNLVEGAGIKLKVKYTDTALPADKVASDALVGSFEYTALDASLALAGAPAQIKVQVGYKSAAATGKAYFDFVTLMASSTLPLPLPR
jgi:cyanophycinase